MVNSLQQKGSIQEELKSGILLRCVGGQLRSRLNLTIGDNVQYSTLREQVLQWDRSQQKWATSMVASSSTDYQGPRPMDIDRVQDAKGQGKKGKNDYQQVCQRQRKERIRKGRCGNMLHLWEARTSCSRLEKQYSTDCKCSSPFVFRRSFSDYSDSWPTTSQCEPAEQFSGDHTSCQKG